MSRKLWIALAILLAFGLLVVGLAARSLVAGPSMTFLVTIEGRAPSGGGWLAHRYESREACYVEGAPKADLRPGQVVDVTGRLQGTRDGRKVIIATAINVDVPQYFPTGSDFDDTGLSGLSDPNVPSMPPSGPDKWTQISGTVQGAYGQNPDRYLFRSVDGGTWVIYLPGPHKDFRAGDGFTVIGVQGALCGGYRSITVESVEWPELREYTGPFPGDLIKEIRVIEAKLPTKVVLSVSGQPPLRDFHISYGFLVDFNGAEHEVSPSDVRYEVRPDGTQLIEIAIEPGHEDLVAGRWTLRAWPTFQLIDGVRLEIQQ